MTKKKKSTNITAKPNAKDQFPGSRERLEKKEGGRYGDITSTGSGCSRSHKKHKKG